MEKIKLHLFAEKLELAGYSKRSIETYRYNLELFFRYMEQIENINTVDQILPEHLTAYHTYLQYNKFTNGNYLCPYTIRQRLDAVRRFFKLLYDEGLFAHDYSKCFTLPKAKRSIPRNVPTVQDITTLIDSIKPSPRDPFALRDRCILELLYATGLRATEILTLTISNVNLVDKTLFIHGKGAKDRMVPIGAWVMPWLLEYLTAGREKFAQPGSPDTLFLSFRGMPLAEPNLRDIIHKYQSQTAIKARIWPHGFRHACATHMLAGGADIRYIQELLGHADLNSTQVYTRVDITQLKKVHHTCHPREREYQNA
jgi:integrase/recombinase XerD